MVAETKEIPFSEYKTLSEAQADKLVELSLTPEEKVLREFNKKYAIVRTSTTHVLLQRSETAFELDTRSSFKNFHENDFFVNSEGKSKNKAVFWLKHPLRRTFENIVFDPTQPGDYGRNFNIFKGFAVMPHQGNCSLYWEHVKEVICSAHEPSYQYVRKWMACVVQKPVLLATALVLRGHSLLLRAPAIFFSLDVDAAGALAYRWWNQIYSHMKLWPPPIGKSPGDAHLAGINLRQWLSLALL